MKPKDKKPKKLVKGSDAELLSLVAEKLKDVDILAEQMEYAKQYLKKIKGAKVF